MNISKALLQAHDAEGGARRRPPLVEHAEEKAPNASSHQPVSALSGPALTSTGNVMALQRTVGNQVVQRLLQRAAAPEEDESPTSEEEESEGWSD
jgi:hypothetical protein